MSIRNLPLQSGHPGSQLIRANVALHSIPPCLKSSKIVLEPVMDILKTPTHQAVPHPFKASRINRYIMIANAQCAQNIQLKNVGTPSIHPTRWTVIPDLDRNTSTSFAAPRMGLGILGYPSPRHPIWPVFTEPRLLLPPLPRWTIS